MSLNAAGDARAARGDRPAALEYYQDHLTIAGRLAISDPSNAEWQRNLWASFNKVGDARWADGDLAGALKSYQDSLAIMDRLAKSDPGNAEWQRDLSVSFNKIGDVQLAQGGLEGALNSYQDGLDIIIDGVTKSDPEDAEWQRARLAFIKKIDKVFKARKERLNADPCIGGLPPPIMKGYDNRGSQFVGVPPLHKHGWYSPPEQRCSRIFAKVALVDFGLLPRLPMTSDFCRRAEILP